MPDNKRISTALVSVYHKDGVEPIVRRLHAEGVQLLSTGGTWQFIDSLGIPCRKVEELTGFPSILGGRVKTLHPKVFGGILGRRDDVTDQTQMAGYDIPAIDLVMVDLYPFEEAVASGAGEEAVIEQIDIGGISLIRAAAKNYHDVVVVAGRNQYEPLADILETQGAVTTLEERRWFAKEAFAVSSYYDTAIFNWFDGGGHELLRIAIDSSKHLRYGENPHQQALFFGDFEEMFDQLHGKEVSYNNLLDIHAAVDLIDEFDDTTFAILKHNNPCGVATRPLLVDAWRDALAGDPVSAFGGILITNRAIDKATADEINRIFFEVIIAPDYDVDALEILGQKKNRIILVGKESEKPRWHYRSVLNGMLVQKKDLVVEAPDDCRPVTTVLPTDGQMADMLFANKIVKNSKSNTIVLAGEGQLLGSGIGQTSRVDAVRQAIEKARSFGHSLEGAVMASDAFFPFGDCVQLAHEAGITAIIQPGGSVRDQESIDYCNAHGVAMVMTGIRHFRH